MTRLQEITQTVQNAINLLVSADSFKSWENVLQAREQLEAAIATPVKAAAEPRKRVVGEPREGTLIYWASEAVKALLPTKVGQVTVEQLLAYLTENGHAFTRSQAAEALNWLTHYPSKQSTHPFWQGFRLYGKGVYGWATEGEQEGVVEGPAIKLPVQTFYDISTDHGLAERLTTALVVEEKHEEAKKPAKKPVRKAAGVERLEGAAKTRQAKQLAEKSAAQKLPVGLEGALPLKEAEQVEQAAKAEETSPEQFDIEAAQIAEQVAEQFPAPELVQAE